jgi:UDP-N-acetylglucosamine transferase subunit ALG13
MIFVTIGTSEPFDRLLRTLDGLPGTEEVVVQRGSSEIELSGVRSVDFLTYDQFVEHIRAARVVVAHAGAGSVMTCLAYGKRPVVVPRLSRFGETSDDHQLAFGRRLAEAGLATFVEDPEQLPALLANGAGGSASALNGSSGLIRELRDYLAATVVAR